MDNRFKFRCYYFDENKMYYYERTLPQISKEDEGIAIIMQCTGLKDKNGKLIYEGDIVREWFGETGTYKVVFNEYIAQFEYLNLDDEDYDFTILALQYEGMSEHEGISTDLEIIGNIYENPEILEVE